MNISLLLLFCGNVQSEEIKNAKALSNKLLRLCNWNRAFMFRSINLNCMKNMRMWKFCIQTGYNRFFQSFVVVAKIYAFGNWKSSVLVQAFEVCEIGIGLWEIFEFLCGGCCVFLQTEIRTRQKTDKGAQEIISLFCVLLFVPTSLLLTVLQFTDAGIAIAHSHRHQYCPRMELHNMLASAYNKYCVHLVCFHGFHFPTRANNYKYIKFLCTENGTPTRMHGTREKRLLRGKEEKKERKDKNLFKFHVVG